MVNPEIIQYSDEIENFNEGCLSLPDQFAILPRPEAIVVDYLDFDGEQKQIRADGLLSRCIQHEMDHLEGILFIDYLSKLKKSMIVIKLAKQNEQLDRIVI